MSYCINPDASNRENLNGEKDDLACGVQQLIYCINPDCWQRENPECEPYCRTCGTGLLVNNRYRLVKPLRSLKNRHHTEIFEVNDGETPKVLKILQAGEESPKLVELFEQEAKVLRYLKHPGIPKAELCGYFTFLLSNGQMLRCLIMEKIEGQDLEHWVQKNGPISEEQAMNWLRQIVEILALVHQNKFFHRDIKPSNIMLRQNGQLVLIDFGTAREVSETVIEGRTVTVVYSHGYTAPEQIQGKAVPQSDFFALGRTFVYLLTGRQPDEFNEVSKTNKLLWRDNAPQISKPLADLIDNLMARLPKERPQDTNAILRRLDKVQEGNSRNRIQNGNSRNRWLIAGLVSGVMVVAGLVLLILRPKQELCFTDVSNVPEASVNYGGSTSWAPIRKQVDPAIQAALTKFHLRYEQPNHDEGTPGSSTGIKMLLKGRLTIAQSSRPFWENENQQAQLQGFSLKQERVALDGVAVAVNPQLNIPGLTLVQLQNIYMGKLRNWKQVGGPNLPITPYSRRVNEGGTVDWFIDRVLENQPFGNNVQFVDDTTQGLRQVAANLGGIYYASAPEVVDQCTIRPLPLASENKTQGPFISPYKGYFVPSGSCSREKNQVNQEVFKTGQYPLTRNLFVIYKDFSGGDNDDEKAGRAYANLLLTAQGQKLIKDAGFVPIRSTNSRHCSSP